MCQLGACDLRTQEPIKHNNNNWMCQLRACDLRTRKWERVSKEAPQGRRRYWQQQSHSSNLSLASFSICQKERETEWDEDNIGTVMGDICASVKIFKSVWEWIHVNINDAMTTNGDPQNRWKNEIFSKSSNGPIWEVWFSETTHTNSFGTLFRSFGTFLFLGGG